MGRILVVGSSNTDMIMKVPRLPKPGETISGSDMQVVQGGKGANQAVAAARMGAETTFVACVGEDDFGTQAIIGYEKDGITTSLIKRSKRPTGVALINIGDDGENSITINPGANADLTPSDLGIELFDGVSYLIVQLEVPEDTTVKAIEFAFEAGAKAIFNPAPAKELKDFPFDKVYLFTPNETEAEFYTGIKIQSEVEAESAAAKLRQMGVSNVIITLGKKGAYCSFTNFKGVIKGFDVDVVDTTAAGDVFNGALAVGLMRYEDLQDVIRFAHGASALSVTQLGAQPSIPSLQNVLSFTGLT